MTLNLIKIIDMKKLIYITFMLFATFVLQAQHSKSGGYVISEELDSITANFNVQIKFYAYDTTTLSDVDVVLPENWVMTNISTFPQTFVSNDSTVFSINIQLPNTINLPYYPQTLKFYIHTDTNTTNTTPIIAKIYFTPYNTIEIWNIEDFYSQPREWLNEEEITPVRSFIAKSAITKTII
ncbi:hypothetical protein FACS1894180_2330 [Bacteroidia bacterium]|nr:hypothetical protein FACS1894180_2330 [Bacteroidia bacterium]